MGKYCKPTLMPAELGSVTNLFSALTASGQMLAVPNGGPAMLAE